MSFLKKGKNSYDKGFNVGVMVGRSKFVKGIVGIEVEVEGNKFPKPPESDGTDVPVQMPALKQWSYVDDGSLRGKEKGGDDAEYVLTSPIDFDEVPAALDALYGSLKDYGSVIRESTRTSIHIHLNVQTFFLNRLTSLMALYITFEEVLTEWCGEHRVGNLFCLRAKDAPALVSQIRRFIRANMEAPLQNHNRYAGMNASSISKLGSLEFRALRGVPEPEVIKKWVEILRRLYEVSAEFPDPRDICGNFSGMGPLAFFQSILGDQTPVIRAGIDYTDERVSASIFEGVRMAQDLCYSRDWSKFEGLDFKPDPFGRDAKKLFKQLEEGGNAFASQGGLGDFPPSWGLPVEIILPSMTEPVPIDPEYYEPEDHSDPEDLD